jgi:hypothetical protein
LLKFSYDFYPLKPNKMMLFAYASNMNVKDFTRSLPSTRKIGNAYLPGYEFIFNKTAEDGSAKANVTPVDNPDIPVWGVLLEFTDQDGKMFDKGDWPEHMTLEPMQCVDEAGNFQTALVFVSLPHAVNEYLLPYDWYKEKIITLATIQELPANYIAKLKLMTSKSDPDTKRSDRRVKKFRESL